jgi:hypothetical protein
MKASITDGAFDAVAAEAEQYRRRDGGVFAVPMDASWSVDRIKCSFQVLTRQEAAADVAAGAVPIALVIDRMLNRQRGREIRSLESFQVHSGKDNAA